MEKIQRYLVGTYTEPVLFGTGDILQGKGKGIHFLELNRETKELKLTGVAAGVRNPSYVAAVRKRFVYCVNELKRYRGEDGGSVTFLEWSEDGSDLEVRQTLPTHGQDPCHVAVDEEQQMLVAANFMTGSVCAYRMDDRGMLEESGWIQHQGNSVHPARQTGPHAHSGIWMRGKHQVIVPDLGMDRLMVYQAAEDGSLVYLEGSSVYCKKGNGPRYGEFDRKQEYLYIVNELSSSVTVLKYHEKENRFEEVQEISTLDDTLISGDGDVRIAEACCGQSSAGAGNAEIINTSADLHISPDNRHLYVSNRGHDSITVFGIHPENGTLELLGHTSCGGRTPRNFAVDPSGDFVLVANQDSDVVVLFERNQETGELTKVSSLEVPTPVCVAPIVGSENSLRMK
ncbi:MAG: lactonase family protein [Lachnospiraceae bacterium]|nr:lactonase family protein [Lachnospiraceae bacterium]